MTHRHCWFLLPLLAAGITGAAEPIDLAPQELRIPLGASLNLEFGTVPQRDTTVLLHLKVRQDSPGLGGSNWFMALRLNDRVIEPAQSRKVIRLVNKPLVSPVAPNLPAAWYGGGKWRVLYAPDFQQALGQKFYEGNPYELVIDITDLTNPAAENRLTITNGADQGLARRLGASLDLIIGEAKIEVKPGASPTMTSAAAATHRINRGEPEAGPAKYAGELLPGGGVGLTVGGRKLAFTTSISYPNAGFNTLGASGATGGQAGEVKVVKAAAGGEVTATWPDYAVRRRVRFEPRRVNVQDTFTNRHAEAKLGLIVRHELDLKECGDVPVRLAGNGRAEINDYYAPANPTVHVGLGEVGVGLVCEDDVLRNQGRLYYDAERSVAGARTDMLCLAAGGSATLEWSVYPVASPEYYDFINLVRADWGSNYTVEGAWCFFSPDMILAMAADELKNRLDRLNINFACHWGGWVDPQADKKRIGFGTEVCSDYWADYRRRLKEATAKLHAARPGIKVLIYYDSQRDTYLDAPERYPDSKLTNSQNQQLSTDWSKVYSLTWSMIATADNSYGKQLLKVIDTYMDEIGADGLYWDEMEGVGYGAPLLTFAQPDGHSCLIDPKTFTIQREVGVTTLLGEGHRLAVIDRVRAKGGTLMGNGPTCTRAGLARKVQRMVEIQHNDYWCYEGQLDTPLGYGSSPPGFDNVTRALAWSTLLVGTRTDYPYDSSAWFYPVTPIALHHGYLLGKERIITMHSGRYGWPGETVNCTLALFDKDGKLKQRSEVVAGDGDKRVTIDLADGEVAVLVRR